MINLEKIIKEQERVNTNDPIKIIKMLLDFITSGQRYKQENPYTIPIVAAAIKFYEKARGRSYNLSEPDVYELEEEEFKNLIRGKK